MARVEHEASLRRRFEPPDAVAGIAASPHPRRQTTKEKGPAVSRRPFGFLRRRPEPPPSSDQNFADMRR
jgi:hypothetical protein